MSRISKFVRNQVRSNPFLRGLKRQTEPYRLYKFVKSDGTLDYAEYCRVQTDGNKKKLDKVWVLEENIEFLANFIKETRPAPRFAICHGTRRGNEQVWFRKNLPGCEVIGTEISDTATQFPHTIQWDFHQTKPEWINSVDFIYSNSFDHSYDPQLCLNAWMSCVKPGGICLLEHSTLHGPEGASRMDPFGADLLHMPYLITMWGEGRYYVRQILKSAQKRTSCDYICYLVVERAK